MGGIQTAANILNLMEGSVSAELIDAVVESDDEIGQQIQDKMFVFDNLIDVDDRGIQSLMKEVSTDVLTLALRAADEALKEKYLPICLSVPLKCYEMIWKLPHLLK